MPAVALTAATELLVVTGLPACVVNVQPGALALTLAAAGTPSEQPYVQSVFKFGGW